MRDVLDILTLIMDYPSEAPEYRRLDEIVADICSERSVSGIIDVKALQRELFARTPRCISLPNLADFLSRHEAML